MPSSTSPTTTQLRFWLNRTIEALWLITVFLVPLAFLDPGYAMSETIIAYVEVPKVALLRTLVGLTVVLWLIDWTLRGAARAGGLITLRSIPSLPIRSLAWLRNAMRGHPHRWLLLAVGFYMATTLISTALSGAFQTSLWGEAPGQDGYAAYTVAAYVLLFTVIATHLKTRPQLWRLLGAIVTMGVLVSGYAVLQHYGHDFLNLSEQTSGKVTAFMGNRIFAAAMMLMTIPVTAAATMVALFNLPDRSHAGQDHRPSRLPALAIYVAGGAILAVQFLGLIFTLSRGPWIGAIFAIALMVGLVPVFVGSWWIVTLAMILGLAAAITAGVLINPSLKSDVDPGPVEGTIVIAASEDFAISPEAVAGPTHGGEAIASPATTQLAEAIASLPTAPDAKPKPPETLRTITVEVDPTASQALERLSSLKEVATGGRQTHWRVSWILIKDRPWFVFDRLNLRWLRPWWDTAPTFSGTPTS